MFNAVRIVSLLAMIVTWIYAMVVGYQDADSFVDGLIIFVVMSLLIGLLFGAWLWVIDLAEIACGMLSRLESRYLR